MRWRRLRPTSPRRGRGAKARPLSRAALPAFAADASAVLPARAARASSMATLLASEVLRDGEVVLLALRPSLWFIVLTSARWITAGAVLVAVAGVLASHDHAGAARVYVEIGSSLIAGRMMWAALQWAGRLYVLTDLRVLTVWGIYRVDVFDCPLRKVARTRLLRPAPERVVGVGSVEVVPQAADKPFGLWQTVPRPADVHAQIVATIARAKQGCEWE